MEKEVILMSRWIILTMSMFRKITLIFLLILPTLLFSQTEINLDNNLTGLYSENKSGKQFGLNFIGNNSFQKNKLSVDLSTNYSIRMNPSLTENEFIQRANLGYNKDYFDVFVTYQYNYSYTRNIISDNWLGIGGGIKKKFNWGKSSLSYAFIYENLNYLNNPTDRILRHSIRLKLKVEKKIIGLSTEYYYQPSIGDFKDYIIYGTTKITILPEKSFSFIFQDVINYRNISDVKMIHNLSIGCSYKFSKKIENKQ